MDSMLLKMAAFWADLIDPVCTGHAADEAFHVGLSGPAALLHGYRLSS